jgi:hypothetical protein
MLMSDPRDTPEGVLANLAQVLLTLLFLHLDAEHIRVPRTWIAAWYQNVMTVLGHLRHP